VIPIQDLWRNFWLLAIPTVFLRTCHFVIPDLNSCAVNGSFKQISNDSGEMEFSDTASVTHLSATAATMNKQPVHCQLWWLNEQFLTLNQATVEHVQYLMALDFKL
jgi:hypothetical protein